MGDRSQDGTDDAELAAMSRALRPKAPNFYASSYEPTLRDQIAAYFIGDQMPTVERRRLVEGMLGSSGVGHTSLGLADIAPGGPGDEGQMGQAASRLIESVANAIEDQHEHQKTQSPQQAGRG